MRKFERKKIDTIIMYMLVHDGHCHLTYDFRQNYPSVMIQMIQFPFLIDVRSVLHRTIELEIENNQSDRIRTRFLI